MIYFKDELRKKAEALHTVKDFADAFKDLSRIEYTINHIFTQADLEEAKKLDDEFIQEISRNYYNANYCKCYAKN